MSLTPARLRRITRHRRRLERMQEQKFAVARQATAAREAAVAAARQSREAALDSGGQAQGLLDPALLGANSAYLVRARNTIGAREAALKHSRVAEQAELDVLLGRRRDRKATETLLDARLAEDRKRREQDEMRRIDESAARNWQRGRDAAPPPPREGAAG